MRCVLLLMLLLAPAPRVQDTDSVAEPLPIHFAPRVAVAGMRLVSATSTLHFEGVEDRPHRLVATYIFPDRARWSLRAIGEEKERGARLLRYRAGDRYFALEPNEVRSRELVDDLARQALLQMELRRAALLWPDGFEWRAEGAARVTKLPCGGVLRAEFEDQVEDAARPIRFVSTYADGTECERFEAVRWNPETRWPAGFELWLGEARVWTEEFTEILHRGDFLDVFFVPPDRRLDASARLGTAELQHIDLPQRAVRRRVVDPPCADVAAARKSASDYAAVWSRELEAAGDPREVAASVELNAEGSVTAWLARIDEVEHLPDAWRAELVPDGPALFTSLGAAGTVDRSALRALLESRPVGAKTGAFELRWDAEGEFRLLLPLLPRDH